MLKYDNVEYWQTTTWDRYAELEKVPPLIRHEFLQQERLTISKISDLSKMSGCELHIMDMAGGTGRISESILKALSDRAHIVLVDFNSKTIKKANTNLANYDNVDFVLLDAYEIGNRFSDYFDIVVSLDFFHHISRLDILFHQIQRAMRPNGMLIGNVFAAESYARWEALKYGVARALLRRTTYSITNYIYPWLPPTLKERVRQYGLARLSPMSKNELVTMLRLFSHEWEIKDSYYYWFAAYMGNTLT